MLFPLQRWSLGEKQSRKAVESSKSSSHHHPCGLWRGNLRNERTRSRFTALCVLTTHFIMATLRMTPLARHLQLRLPASWLPARSIATSHPLVPPQASTSQVEADLAAVPGLQDTTAAASSSASTSQHKLPYYITRTEMNKALPVYSNIRSGGTRQEVLIRHISGNLEVL